jgi:hypothetical protein
MARHPTCTLALPPFSPHAMGGVTEVVPPPSPLPPHAPRAPRAPRAPHATHARATARTDARATVHAQPRTRNRNRNNALHPPPPP